MLFVGGSSSAHQNSKGVAFGCDASCVSILAFLLAWESLTKAPGRLPMVEALLQVSSPVCEGSKVSPVIIFISLTAFVTPVYLWFVVTGGCSPL